MSDKHVMVKLTDKMIWDGGSKTAISVRDGVLEYDGSELGMEPGKTYRVYRSPATISNIAMTMKGTPLTDEHVDLDTDVAEPVGTVTSAEMIDFFEDDCGSTLAIKNVIDIKGKMLDTLNDGKKELSLGYLAELVPHKDYDFEQKNVQPHHLAVVSAGRCGHGCKFIDKKGIAMEQNKAFVDADGNLNLEQIVEIAMALPEALKAIPVDKLQDVLPQLQGIVEMAKAASGEPMPEVGDEVGPDGDRAGEGALPDTKTDEQVDEEIKDEEDAEIVDEEMEEDEEKKVKVTDTAEFKDAVEAAVKNHCAVISKAVEFIDSVEGKSTDEIMKEAVATQYEIKDMAADEIKVAFKLLRKDSQYKNFGDQDATNNFWNELGKKEI